MSQTRTASIHSGGSTPEKRPISRAFSPPRVILKTHAQKLNGWDEFIEEQQLELQTKKDSLQNLELKLAKIAYVSAQDKCEKVDQWEKQKRYQFEREQHRIALRTQRLDREQMELGNHKLTLEMEHKTKLLEAEKRRASVQREAQKMDEMKMSIQRRESILKQKEEAMARQREQLDEEYREYQSMRSGQIKKERTLEDMEKDSRGKQVELKLIESEYKRNIEALNEEKMSYIAKSKEITVKEQEYMTYINDNERRMLKFCEQQNEIQKSRNELSVKEQELIGKEREMNRSIMTFQSEMDQREEELREREKELESRCKAMNEESSRMEVKRMDLVQFQHELEKKRMDLVQEKNRITHLFDSFGAPQLS